MKKYITTLSLVLILLLNSCQDFLNLPPKNTKVIYTISDVRGAMSTFLYATSYSSYSSGYVSKPIRFNGLYIQYPFHRYTNLFTALYTNDIDLKYFYDPTVPSSHANYGGKPYLSWYTENKKWEGYKFSKTIWDDTFGCIGYLNMVLKDLEKVPDYNQKDYEQISGEARVIRAFYLFRLNQLFAPYDMEDYGIPINLDADQIVGSSRWKQSTVYKTLINEIEEVLEYKTPSSATWNIFYNERVMKAILAQIYQYKAESCAKEAGDWGKAEKYAKEARGSSKIESNLEEQIELTCLQNSTFIDRAHPYSLLRISVSYTSSASVGPWGYNGVWQQSPTSDLYNLYDANDIRRTAYFSTIPGSDRVYLTKYALSATRTVNSLHNLFRMSELMLIEAEALARQGKNDNAIQLLNSFKASKIPGYSGYKGGQVLDEILRERRKEFVLEELTNWIDMKRVGVTVTREAINEETLAIESFTLESNDYRYTLPIPADSELRFNNIPQNIGWK